MQCQPFLWVTVCAGIEQQMLDSVIVKKGRCTIVLRYLYAEGISFVPNSMTLFLEAQYSTLI